MQHGNIYSMLLMENQIVRGLSKYIQIYSFNFFANFSSLQVLWVRGTCVWGGAHLLGWWKIC